MDILTLSITNDLATHKKVVNHRFRLLHTIGQGQYGKVLLAEDLEARESQYVAVKTINRLDKTKLITQTYMSHTTKIKREIQIMKECNHPNVVKLVQVIDDIHFDKIFLVLEYCQFGEIDWKRYNHYQEKYYKKPGLPLNKILRDVINGLEYLHTYKHIIHRDLKPSNLLISHDRTIKILDFGVSLILENNANDERELGKTMGTPAFYAPELCQFVNNRLLMFNDMDLKKSHVDARIDIWSLGVILYCLIFNQLPFEGRTEFELFQNIVNAPLKFPPTRESTRVQPADLEELSLLKKLISKMLAKNADNRPTVGQIKCDPFTVFDLRPLEIEKFENFNRELVKHELPLLAQNWAAEKKLLARIKRVFRSDAPTALPPSLLPLMVRMRPENPDNVKIPKLLDLEKVDDLLDLYLDDLSLMGSLDEPEVVDTDNLLAALHEDLKHNRTKDENSTKDEKPANPESVVNSLQIMNLSNKRDRPGSVRSAHQVSLDKLEGSSLVKSDHLDKNELSSSVQNDRAASRFDNENSTSNLSNSDRINSEKMRPPPLNFRKFDSSFDDNAITIGAGSPLSYKSMFSPSRRFFARFKKKPEPSLLVLSAPSTLSSYSDFTPPPTLGQKRLSGDLTVSIDTYGRKSSVLSMTGSLSKMPSSSSLLNLHAYLTDSASSSPLGRNDVERFPVFQSNQEEEDDDYNGEADRTFTMDEYIDKL